MTEEPGGYRMTLDHPGAVRRLAVLDIVLDHMLDGWSLDPSVFPSDIRQAYVAQSKDPARVHAIFEAGRAAATIDCEHDADDNDVANGRVCSSGSSVGVSAAACKNRTIRLTTICVDHQAVGRESTQTSAHANTTFSGT